MKLSISSARRCLLRWFASNPLGSAPRPASVTQDHLGTPAQHHRGGEWGWERVHRFPSGPRRLSSSGWFRWVARNFKRTNNLAHEWKIEETICQLMEIRSRIVSWRFEHTHTHTNRWILIYSFKLANERWARLWVRSSMQIFQNFKWNLKRSDRWARERIQGWSHKQPV